MNTFAQRVRRSVMGTARSMAYALRAGARRFRSTGETRFLLVASFDPFGLGNARESVESIVRYSRHRFDLLNLCGLHPLGGVRLPPYVRLADYDGLLIHHSLPYTPEALWNLDRRRRETIGSFDGLKILMRQDEQSRVNEVVDFIRDTHVDLLLTCVPAAHVRQVYPESKLPRIRFLHVRAGYVTERMRQFRFTQDDRRPIDIGYRGSSAPLAFGRLSYEKREIGDLFQRVCAARGLRADISSRTEDRLYGKRWYRFLARSKATLGVESGGTVFDFSGEVQRQVSDYLAENPRADFETVHRLFLAPLEDKIPYRQIAPRHFEAAACRTLQIMYEGEYSGIFQPGRHYLSLRRDRGNLDEVLERFLDPRERKRITKCAFDEIIRNDEYLDSTFVRHLDDAIDAALESRLQPVKFSQRTKQQEREQEAA